MQGKGLSLRLSLVALVVVLVFGTLGGFSLARDAFDADYDDCPAATRLDAVDGLTIDRTDEEDEIRISWDALTSASLSSLGPNGYRARLTVIVDGEDARNVALGDTNMVVSDIDFAEDLTVSVAITLKVTTSSAILRRPISLQDCLRLGSRQTFGCRGMRLRH